MLKKHAINAQLFLNEPHQLNEYIIFFIGQTLWAQNFHSAKNSVEKLLLAEK